MGVSTMERGNQSRFVRQFVLSNPNVTWDQIAKAWEDGGNPKSSCPTKQMLYVARNNLKNKYDVDSLEKLPRKASGEINISGLLRLLIKKRPNMSETQCRHYLKSDGIDFTKSLWLTVSGEFKGAAGSGVKLAATDSPDENQGSGPRARVVKNSPKSTVNQKPSDSISLEKIESQLDDLIRQAQDILDSSVVSDLKNARRRIGQQLLTKV